MHKLNVIPHMVVKKQHNTVLYIQYEQLYSTVMHTNNKKERERVTIADDVSFILLDNAHAHPAESELVGGHYFKHKQNT